MKGKPTLGTRIKIPEAAAKPKLVAAAGAKTKRSLKDDLGDDVPF